MGAQWGHASHEADGRLKGEQWRGVRSGIRRGRFALLIVVVVLAAGIIWGVGGALAASPAASPSSAPGQVVLHLGWTSEPDNLNVFVGYMSECWEIWALNYDYLFGSGQHNQPALDLASQFPTQQNGGISADGKVWTIHIRSGVKFQDGVPLTAVRRRLHLQLRDQERHRPVHHLHRRDRVGQGARPDDGAAHLRPSHGRRLHGVAVGADPAGAHLEARLPPRRPPRATATRRRSSAAAPSRRCATSRAATSRWTETPTTGAPSRPSTRSSSRSTRTPRPW